MARKRLIDTDGLYFSTELIEILGDRGLHLYIRLWGVAEDWGGYEPKYADIALQMGALKFSPEEVEGFINKLINKKKLCPYEVKGQKVHWIVNFLEHQPLDNPSLPKLPLPGWIKCKIFSYKSGRKYANYRLIESRLPVGYCSTSCNGVTVTVKKRNSNVTVTNNTPQEIYDFYSKVIKPGAKEDAIRNITKLLRTASKEELIGRINAYKQNLLKKGTDERFYIQANNFFGQAARWKDFEPAKPVPESKPDPNCHICNGKGRIPEGSQKGAQCLCVK